MTPRWHKLSSPTRGAFKLLSLFAQCLHAQLHRICDDDGRIDIGSREPVEAVLRILACPSNQRQRFRTYLEELVKEGFLLFADGQVLIADFPPRSSQRGSQRPGSSGGRPKSSGGGQRPSSRRSSRPGPVKTVDRDEPAPITARSPGVPSAPPATPGPAAVRPGSRSTWDTASSDGNHSVHDQTEEKIGEEKREDSPNDLILSNTPRESKEDSDSRSRVRDGDDVLVDGDWLRDQIRTIPGLSALHADRHAADDLAGDLAIAGVRRSVVVAAISEFQVKSAGRRFDDVERARRALAGFIGQAKLNGAKVEESAVLREEDRLAFELWATIWASEHRGQKYPVVPRIDHPHMRKIVDHAKARVRELGMSGSVRLRDPLKHYMQRYVKIDQKDLVTKRYPLSLLLASMPAIGEWNPKKTPVESGTQPVQRVQDQIPMPQFKPDFADALKRIAGAGGQS